MRGRALLRLQIRHRRAGKGLGQGLEGPGLGKGDKKPALNPDLWERLLELCDRHQVKLHWVKGHASNPYNNRCDELAVGEWQKIKEERRI